MQQLAEAAQDEAAFSMRVLRHLASRDGGGGSRANLAVSPLSLHAALALLAAGARRRTLHEIASFLGPAGGSAHAALASYVTLRVLACDGGGDGESGTTLRFAHAVWVDADLQLKASFARVAAEHYRAVARQAFFKTAPEEARSQINEWIASATAGRIKDLLPAGSLHDGTPAVLANALYFKGAWERKFDARLTRDDAFVLHDGRAVRVPFMSSTRKQLVACRPDYKVLRLRYAHDGGGGGEHRLFSMYIYLPDARDGLPALLHKLSADPAALLESSGTLTEEVPVRAFRVPRFTVAYKTKAKETLMDLGLRLPFDRVAADFGDMVEAAQAGTTLEPIFVSDVYHESFVEVNEEGTEAAAATAVVMGFGCARVEAPPPVDFVADRPFVFLIKEEFSGVVVFAGQVVDPSI